MNARAVFVGTGHFDHVFLCLCYEGHWLKLDSAWGRLTLAYLGPDDPAIWYREQGCTVLETESLDQRLFSPIIPASCVALVKRLLGLRKPFICTTRQLYRFLERSR